MYLGDCNKGSDNKQIGCNIVIICDAPGNTECNSKSCKSVKNQRLDYKKQKGIELGNN